MDLIGISRTIYPNAEKYTFFSSAHGTFSRTDHILGHKSNLSKFKFYQASSKNSKNTNTWRLSNMFLNNQQVTVEIKKEIKKILERNDNENTTTQNLWDTAKAVLRGKFRGIQSYLKKQEKHQIDNISLHLRQLENRRILNK